MKSYFLRILSASIFIALSFSGLTPAEAVNPRYFGTFFKGDAHALWFGQGPTFYMTKDENLKFTVVGQGVHYALQRQDSSGNWTTVREADTNDSLQATEFNMAWPWSYGLEGKQIYRMTITAGSKVINSSPQTFYTANIGYKAPPSSSPEWSLIYTPSRGIPARMNPCAVVNVYADTREVTGGSQAQAIDDLQWAINFINTNFGMNLRYGGERNFDSVGSHYPSEGIAVKWAANLSPLAPGADTLNNIDYLYNAKFISITASKIIVNSDKDKSNLARDGVIWRRFILSHELGHSLGAGHPNYSDGTNSLMGAYTNNTAHANNVPFGYGDKILAKILGARAGCYGDFVPTTTQMSQASSAEDNNLEVPSAILARNTVRHKRRCAMPVKMEMTPKAYQKAKKKYKKCIKNSKKKKRS
jgi:hypothetical protein